MNNGAKERYGVSYIAQGGEMRHDDFKSPRDAVDVALSVTKRGLADSNVVLTDREEGSRVVIDKTGEFALLSNKHALTRRSQSGVSLADQIKANHIQIKRESNKGKLCSVPGCKKEAEVKGMCRPHYRTAWVAQRREREGKRMAATVEHPKPPAHTTLPDNVAPPMPQESVPQESVPEIPATVAIEADRSLVIGGIPIEVGPGFADLKGVVSFAGQLKLPYHTLVSYEQQARDKGMALLDYIRLQIGDALSMIGGEAQWPQE